MLPAIRWRISSTDGSGFAATSAAAETTCPGVQKPHCTASAFTKAATSGWSRNPSMVVTSPCTVCASVMHDSVGTPSTCTVHAPQWPSLHAPFVPVSPSRSRRTVARLAPIGTSTTCSSPFTTSVTSGTGRHRHDVGEVDEPRRRACDDARRVVVLCLGQRAPELASRDEDVVDLVELLDVPVRLVTRIQSEPERAERVLLPRVDERHRHREVLVDACEHERLLEDLRALRLRRLERRDAVGDPIRVPGEDLVQL